MENESKRESILPTSCWELAAHVLFGYEKLDTTEHIKALAVKLWDVCDNYIEEHIDGDPLPR